MMTRRVLSPRATFCALTAAAMLALTGCGDAGTGHATWQPAAGQAAPGQGGGLPYGATAVSNPGAGATPATAATVLPSPSATATTPPPPPPPSPSATATPSGSTAPSGAPPLAWKTTGDDTVALTFDDGPSSFTPQILSMLREHNIKATFCLVGVEVRAHHDLVRQIVNEGHSLCNHTWKHDLKLGTRSPETILADLQATNDEIHRAVPDAPIRYFRHPGGNFTPAAVAGARSLGMEPIGWEVDPTDWDLKKYQGSKMTERILSVVRQHTKAGSIVLSHDAGGDRSATMVAYRTLLPELKSRFKLAALPVPPLQR